MRFLGVDAGGWFGAMVSSPDTHGGASDFCLASDLCLTLLGQLLVSYALAVLAGAAFGASCIHIRHLLKNSGSRGRDGS